MNSSFSLNASTAVLSSNFFYPSEYKVREVEDRGSLYRTITEQGIDLFARGEKINSCCHRYGKPLRAIARAVAFLAIGILIAPIGCVWHAMLTVGRAILCLRGGVHTSHNWTKVKQHIAAFFTDLLITGLAALTCSTFVEGVFAGEAIAFVASIAVAANLFSPLSSFIPHESLPLFLASRNERVAFYKSIMLKNAFGLVGKQGKLLTWNAEKDQEFPELTGLFGTIYQQQGLDFLEAINELQKVLIRNNCRLPSFYPPEATSIISFMEENREKLEKRNIDIMKWINKFQILDANLKFMSKLLVECTWMKHVLLFVSSGLKRSCPFPWIKEICDPYFSWAWDETLTAEMVHLTGRVDGFSDEFKVYRQRLRERKDPHELLGLSTNSTTAELNQAKRDAFLHIHPDKVNASLRGEAEAVFRCVNEACDILVHSQTSRPTRNALPLRM